MPAKEDTEGHKRSPQAAGSIQDTFRRAYHLRTLYDVSNELFGTVEFEKILRKFLLMSMGNFGVREGFILVYDVHSEEITHYFSMGFQDHDRRTMHNCCMRILRHDRHGPEGVHGIVLLNPANFPSKVVCLLPFRLNSDCSGILALGAKLTGEPYSEDDSELLVTLVNNLIVALRNARSFENISSLNQQLKENNERLEKAHNELDRRLYHLKTLYDVSKDIFGTVEFEAILRSFLLMSTGNFGVIEGFILTQDVPSNEITHFMSVGFADKERASLTEIGGQFLSHWNKQQSVSDGSTPEERSGLSQSIALALPFSVDETCSGLLGLGPKLIGEPYSEEDKELLSTLVNNLTIALKSARSFEEIRFLNKDLQEKNVQLEKILNELQASMRKVELLESIKANLSKFVPATVSRLIEKSPTSSMPEAKEQDVSVLFLDIEGYTKLSERLDGAALNKLIERYFSVFMDAIHANNGDVNETAGDGLMVLFLNKDAKTNALEAVHTSLIIREKAALINQGENAPSEPLIINMGINSGRALVGAAKFESYTGSRWTYTARGMVTNVAARIGALASDGAIHLSRRTSDRVKAHFSLTPLGKFGLKNVSEEVEIFTVNG